MSNPLIYVLWLVATGGAILAYVARRRKRSTSDETLSERTAFPCPEPPRYNCAPPLQSLLVDLSMGSFPMYDNYVEQKSANLLPLSSLQL